MYFVTMTKRIDILTFNHSIAISAKRFTLTYKLHSLIKKKTSLLWYVTEPLNTAGKRRGPAVPASKHNKIEDKH